MASFVTPKKNAEYICYVSLRSQADTKLFQANPTIAAGDFKVSTDGGALGNLATLPTVTPASGRMVKITLSASEMNGDNVTVVCVDAAGAEWCDLTLNIQTSARQVDDLMFPTVSGRSADVAVTGEMGLDFNNVLSTSLITLHSLTVAGATTLTGAVSFGSTWGVTGAITFSATWTGNLTGTASGNATAAQGANLDAPISSRMASYSQPAGFLAASFPTDPADQSLIIAATDAVMARLGAPAGASLSADIAAIEAQTDDIGALGAGLSAIPWNPAWDAEVQSEVADAVDAAMPSSPTSGSINDRLKNADLRGSRVVARCTVGSASTTTSVVTSACSPSGAAADQFKGRIIVFDTDTATAALRGQATDITASSNSATPTLTVTALTTAPASSDTFTIL